MSEDTYPQARQPRRDTGCPACGADIKPTTSKEVWPQHPIGGVKGAERCGLSGHGISYQTDVYFRTFFDRENPEGFPVTGHQITTQLEDMGDAIGVINRLAIASGYDAGPGHPVAEITSRIVEDDYPRLRDELDRHARKRGWVKQPPRPSREAFVAKAAQNIARVHHDGISTGPDVTDDEWRDIWEVVFTDSVRARYHDMASVALVGLPARWWA